MIVYHKINENLIKELTKLENQNIDTILKCENAMPIISNALMQLREHVISAPFKNKEQEIDFFKNIKPKIYCLLIYHARLLTIENKRPISNSKAQLKYLHQQIDKLQTFFKENLDFYRYYKRKDNSLDMHYFIRGKSEVKLLSDSFYFSTDKQFTTSHDSMVATIIAYEMLIAQLSKQISQLKNNKKNMETITTSLNWTGTKTDLTELIYALQSSGVINHGTSDIIEIKSALEELFGAKIDDPYRTFLNIRLRKINRTKFLDFLRESLLKRIEKLDE